MKIAELILFHKDITNTVSSDNSDGRVMILYFQLYMEHYILAISKIKNIEGTPKEKAKKLHELYVIPGDIYQVVKLTFKLRDKLVHKLLIDKEFVLKKLKDIKVPIKTDDKDVKEYFQKIDTWQAYHTTCTMIICTLYDILCSLLEIKPKFKIRPSIFIDKDKVRIQMDLLERKNSQYQFIRKGKRYNFKDK